MNKTEFAKRYCLDSVVKPTAKKKRYEVHYQAQDPKGNVFLLVKEAVCAPGELRGILKKFESEQKAKGNKIISELYRKSFAVDSVSVNDKTEVFVVEGTFNGQNIKKTFGGLVDAQNNAYGFIEHGGKNFKVYKIVDGVKKQLVRSFR